MSWTRSDDGLTHYKANPICPTFGVGDCTPIQPTQLGPNTKEWLQPLKIL